MIILHFYYTESLGHVHRIQKFVKTQLLLRILLAPNRIQRIFLLYPEIFENDMSTCGWSYPEICEYAYVILLDPVFTASIVNKLGVQQGCSFFVSCSDCQFGITCSDKNSCDKFTQPIHQRSTGCFEILSGYYKVKTRANHHRRRFQTRPGRTSAWWDYFINGTMIEEEWRENFRMSKTSLVKLDEELRPYIEGKQTILLSPVDVFSSDKLQASTVYTSQWQWRERNGAKIAIMRTLIS